MPLVEDLETKSELEILEQTPALDDNNDLSSPKNASDDNVLIVDWDGPSDPENPKKTFKEKWVATAITSAFTFISPISSSMVAPATGQIAQQFHITSSVIIAMTVSVFVLAYAVGPLLLAPLSEMFGRSRVLQLSNLFFLVFNLGCAFAQNESQLIAMRFLSGLGGSAPIAIGGGVISDVWTQEERGTAIAIYSLAPLLGPVLGPVTGAWIAEKSTWRWVFRATCIVDGAIQCLGLIFLRETYAPVLLQWKAAKISKEMKSDDSEKGQQKKIVRTIYEGKDRSLRALFQKTIVRPVVFGATEPTIQLFGIYQTFIYGLMYLYLTSIPSIFEKTYNETVGISGLHYIALGIGITAGAQISAPLLDRTYAYLKVKNGGVRRPEYRLPPLIPGTLLLPIGLLITGWTVEAKTHWIGADFGLLIFGIGLIMCFQCSQSYVIDSYGLHTASALAAVGFMRSIAGFGFPLFAPAMYNALGHGKADTILAAVGIAIGCPAPWLFWKFGKRIRSRSKYAVKA